MPCASLASLWRVERLTLRAAGPGVASSSCCTAPPGVCTNCTKHQQPLGMTLAPSSWLASPEWPLPLGWHAGFSTGLSSLPLAPLTSKPHALPLILPLTPMHTDICLILQQKMEEVLQIKVPSSIVLTRKRHSQRAAAAVPGWQMQIVSAATSSVRPPGNNRQLALGQISECRFPHFF